MKKIFSLLIAVVFLSGCGTKGVYKEKVACEWQNLFDGESLDGWVHHGGKALFGVEGGCIVGTTVPGATHNAFLCTEKDYKDFVMELDFKVHPRLNSGIQIRSHVRQDPNLGEVVYGYQVEIDPTKRRWSAGIYHEGASKGWQCNLENNEAARDAYKPEDWNHLTIKAVGSTIKTWINNVPAAEVNNADADERGFIGLQVHRIREDDLRQVRWRNIRIKVLD